MVTFMRILAPKELCAMVRDDALRNIFSGSFKCQMVDFAFDYRLASCIYRGICFRDKPEGSVSFSHSTEYQQLAQLSRKIAEKQRNFQIVFIGFEIVDVSIGDDSQPHERLVHLNLPDH